MDNQSGSISQKLFKLVAYAGHARSAYIQAMRVARTGDIEQANVQFEAAQQRYQRAHNIHLELLSLSTSASVNAAPQATDAAQASAHANPLHARSLFNDGDLMMLIHAEDQLMSAETFGILAQEAIDANSPVHPPQMLDS